MEVIWIGGQTKQEWVELNSDIEQERLNGEAPMINLDDIPEEINGDSEDA